MKEAYISGIEISFVTKEIFDKCFDNLEKKKRKYTSFLPYVRANFLKKKKRKKYHIYIMTKSSSDNTRLNERRFILSQRANYSQLCTERRLKFEPVALRLG